MKKLNFKNKSSRFNIIVASAAGISVMAVGFLLIAAQAAGPVASVESEQGTLTGNAEEVADDSASGSNAIRFGLASEGGDDDDDQPGTGEIDWANEPKDASECTTTAAEKYGWGEPQYASHFNTPGQLDPTWHPYGPEPGHAKNGIRTPEQITVADGNVTLTGKEGGTTAAMKWFPGQKYGRWEGCLKVSQETAFNALFLHWSDDETFSNGGGEIDWAEIFGDRNKVNYFLHCGSGGNCNVGSTSHNTTEWTSYAMEWTPTTITAYINGEVWHQSTDPGQFPPRPMNWCIQLDWFGSGGTSWMSVDWTKQWPIAESEPSSLGLMPGEPATGQPGDYPERKPRPMSIEDMLPY